MGLVEHLLYQLALTMSRDANNHEDSEEQAALCDQLTSTKNDVLFCN